jgi:hypothetical protein
MFARSGSLGRAASSRGAGSRGTAGVSRGGTGFGRVWVGKGPARTGTYALVLRRRSGTRLAWSQGRLCPSRRDSAARRRGPARFAFFIPGFLMVNHPRSCGSDVLFPHKNHVRKKRYAARAHTLRPSAIRTVRPGGFVSGWQVSRGWRVSREEGQVRDSVGRSKTLYAREHTDSSSVGEVERDPRGNKGVSVHANGTALLAAVVRRDSLFSSRVFRGQQPSEPQPPRMVLPIKVRTVPDRVPSRGTPAAPREPTAPTRSRPAERPRPGERPPLRHQISSPFHCLSPRSPGRRPSWCQSPGRRRP